MVKEKVEAFIESLEKQKEADWEKTKEQVVHEKILPFNLEIDQALVKAQEEVKADFKSKHEALYKEEAGVLKELTDKGEAKKRAYMDSCLQEAKISNEAEYAKLLKVLKEV